MEGLASQEHGGHECKQMGFPRFQQDQTERIRCDYHLLSQVLHVLQHAGQHDDLADLAEPPFLLVFASLLPWLGDVKGLGRDDLAATAGLGKAATLGVGTTATLGDLDGEGRGDSGLGGAQTRAGTPAVFAHDACGESFSAGEGGGEVG